MSRNQPFASGLFSRVTLGLVLAVNAHVKVMMIHNSLEASFGYREGFYDFFVPFLDEEVDEESHGGLNVSLCGDILDAAKVQSCLDSASSLDIDAIVVATSTLTSEIKDAAEQYKIPNIHCSGSDPASWSGRTPHAFGVQLPFTWYSRNLIQQAALNFNVHSVMVIRDADSSFSRMSAVASLEWSRISSLRVIGPTVSWCNLWSIYTKTCSLQGTVCRCGKQSEFDALNYKYRVDSMASFYEVCESLVVEDGHVTNGNLSPSLVAFLEGIMEDVKSQGADPELVMNWLTSSKNVFKAMQRMAVSYKIYFDGNDNLTALAKESYWRNGSIALTAQDSLYHVSGGQWHPQSNFADPYFGSTHAMTSRYEQKFGNLPNTEAAACVAAGITLTYGLQKYGPSMVGLSTSERREEIRLALGRFDDETIFGNIRFNRFNQNTGRSSISWQVLEDGAIRPVLPSCSLSQTLRSQSPSWQVRSGCPAGSYAPRSTLNLSIPLECVLCQEGTFRSTPTAPLEFSQCEECGQGRGTLPGGRGQSECLPCPGGTFQNGNSDQGICKPCPLGTFRNASSSSSEGCLPCQAHTFADVPGLDACKPCPSFASQPTPGQGWCLCDIGSYKDPSDTATQGATLSCLSCDSLILGSTTRAAEGLSGPTGTPCVCPAGTFWHKPHQDNPFAECKSCGKGLVCRGGLQVNGTSIKHQVPLQAAGYSAGVPLYEGGNPTYIVTCTSKIRCPGELPLGSCPAANAGIGCVSCEANHYDDAGICRSCADSAFSVWPLIVAIALGIIALAVLYKFATSMDRTSRDSLATIFLGVGFVIVIFQGIPEFDTVQVEWIEPMDTLRSVFLFMTFNVDLLRPGCWMNGRNPLINYVGSLACYPFGALAVLCLLGVSKYFKAHVSWNEAINAVGVMLLACYIAFVSLTLRPFRCVGNPDGTASMMYYRDIICWKDEVHWAMVGLSLLPFLSTVVAFYALTVWAVINYGSRVARSGGVKFVKRFSFLFGRFDPNHYYFVLILNTRNLLIGTIPVVLQMYSELICVLFTLVLTLYGFLQVHIWPWRTNLSNVADASLGLCAITTITMGVILLDFNVARHTIIIQIVSLIFSIIILLLAFISGALVVYRAYRPKRTYGMFLSHHKLGAAVLARWFKMIMGEYVTDRIFLDSDDVSKLDAILDITSWDTQNVVVLMTSETMKRMWCAAEVASAWDSGTNIVLVSCDGNEITERLIDAVPDLWSEQQQATLASTGVTLDLIVDAYKALLDVPAIHLSRKGARTDAHYAAVREILSECKGLSRQVLSRLTTAPQRSGSFSSLHNAIYLIGDMSSPEPGCCCRVIQTMLQSSLQELVHIINPAQAVMDLDWLAQELEGAKVILVVLTTGVLHEPTFAGTMSSCPASRQGVLVPIKADESFAYPDPIFWENLEAGKIFSTEILAAMQTDYARVKATYTILFNVLALKFTSHGSAHILATEILVLKDRMMPLLLETAGLMQMETDKRMSKLRQMSFASRSEAASSMDTDFVGRGSARASRKTALQAALQRAESRMSLPSNSSDRASDREPSWAVAPFKRSDVERPAGQTFHQVTMDGQIVNIIKEEL